MDCTYTKYAFGPFITYFSLTPSPGISRGARRI